MKNKTLENSGKKFLFDVNLFDDDHEEETEDLPPPPPVFSEDELEQAGKQAFADGREQGQKEVRESLEQTVTDTLAQIARDMETLFAAEQARAKLYEQEALHLTQYIFETLFPVYRDTHGFDELSAAVKNILDRHHTAKTIHIFTAPNVKDKLQEHIRSLTTRNPDIRFDITADPELTGTTCRMKWKDGGAIYDPEVMAQEILAILKQTLAQEGFTGHDKEDGKSKDADPESKDLMEKPDE